MTLLVLGTARLFTAALFFCFPHAYATFPTRSEMDYGLDCVFTSGSVAMHGTLPSDFGDHRKLRVSNFLKQRVGEVLKKRNFVLVLNVQRH